MIDSSTIFTQLLEFVPYHRFRSLIGQHASDRRTQRCSTWNHFVVLLYAQATGKDSLREIEMGLKTRTPYWHHLGVKTAARSTIAYVNARRPSIVFEHLFTEMLGRFKEVTSDRTFPFENPLYSIDSTTIALCLSLCDWATFRRAKGALKLHTVLDNRLRIPVIVRGTKGSVNDNTEAKRMTLNLERGSILVFDRGYPDYRWWYTLHSEGYFFVTRTKRNTVVRVAEIRTPDTSTILGDDLVWVGDERHTTCYPEMMRRVRYLHEEKGEITFLTNNFTLSAQDIALVYKDRWQIELFFKWVKQNLVIKSFLGTSENAIMSQVWVALTFYLIVAYIKFQTRYPGSMMELTWMIKESLFVRRPILDLLSLSRKTIGKIREDEPLTLF